MKERIERVLEAAKKVKSYQEALTLVDKDEVILESYHFLEMVEIIKELDMQLKHSLENQQKQQAEIERLKETLLQLIATDGDDKSIVDKMKAYDIANQALKERE